MSNYGGEGSKQWGYDGDIGFAKLESTGRDRGGVAEGVVKWWWWMWWMWWMWRLETICNVRLLLAG